MIDWAPTIYLLADANIYYYLDFTWYLLGYISFSDIPGSGGAVASRNGIILLKLKLLSIVINFLSLQI